MIIALTGMPGSGKSYGLVHRAYKSMKQGKPVFSNFPIKGAYQFTLDDLCNYSFPEGSVIIIDEAGRWFNSRSWGTLPPEVFDLFTMHRHLEYDMYIGVQSFARIDKSLREVIELVYVTHKSFFWHLYRGFYDVERVGKIKGQEDVRYYIPKRKKYYKMYDTHSMKSAWHGKPPMPEILYSPAPPLNFKESFMAAYKKLLKKETPLIHDSVQIEELQEDNNDLEAHKEWLEEQPYLVQLEHKNGK